MRGYGIVRSSVVRKVWNRLPIMSTRHSVFAGAWLCAVLACAAHAAGETHVIQNRQVQYRTTIRTTAGAEKAETITNPVNWQPVDFLVEDGSLVDASEVITVFRTNRILTDLGNLEHDRRILEIELEGDLTRIRNEAMELQDRLQEEQDQMAFLTARRLRLESMPDEDEVRITEGRLRVAELNFNAAREDQERGRDRLARGMISEAQMDKYRRDFLEKEALRNHARDMLEYTRLPASTSSLRKVALQIANASMEVERLRHELEETERIAAIKQKGIEARRSILEQQIRERAEEVANATVTAPTGGYVSYTREFKELMRGGGKMWKNFTYMRMPDLQSLVFRGALSQAERKFFEVGDEATIYTAARPDMRLRGSIQSFSQLSRDLLEKREDRFEWGGVAGGEDSGVKVYDVTIRLEEQQDWIRPEMNARCELISSRLLEAPAAPLSYVREEQGRYYLAVNGVYTPVTGDVADGCLLLSDRSLLGKSISLFGRFPEESGGETDAGRGGRLVATGALLPVKTTDVFVQDVWEWPKVTWLIEEDTTVGPGEVLARLDTKELNEAIERFDSEMTGHQSEFETLTEELELKRRESAFTLRRERNLLEIAAIDLELAREGVDTPAILDAELSLRQAQIQLDYVTGQLAAAEDKKRAAISASELERLRRDRIRQQLRVERAGILLAEALKGADAIARSDAQLKYTEQRVKVETLAERTRTELFELEQKLEIARRRVENHVTFMKRVDLKKQNSVLVSPATGLVRFTKVFNSGTISKVNVGSEVGEGFKLMEIADVSRMYLRVEVPEAFFAQVAPGLNVEVRVPSLTDRVLPGSITKKEFLFESKRRSETAVGLYSSHEGLGETVFFVHVALPEMEDVALKPGAVAHVLFPFQERDRDHAHDGI